MKEVVSIVIVSMNRLDNLDICLPSIEKFTKTPHKVFVVAYMFSQKNLQILREKYPHVEVVESNEIRGFSENNNLALHKVTTPFVFIQNDDTEYKEAVLDKLIDAYNKTPNATIISPVLLSGDGTLQFCGRRKYTFFTFILGLLGIHKLPKSKYENRTGIFKSYNVSGAAFLIKTEDFRNIGFFDEKYFFCPEDIAVSTTVNKNGGYCYVDSNSSIIHFNGVSSKKSKLFYATTCASLLGHELFYCNNILKRILFFIILSSKICIMKIENIWKQSQHRLDYIYIYSKVLKAMIKSCEPKSIFIEEYNRVINSNNGNNIIKK